MRTILSAVFTCITILLAPLAASAAWLDHAVVSERGFVELAKPLSADRGFQTSLADALGESLASQSELPAGIQRVVEPLITDTVNQVTTLPGYPGAWEDTLRRSHALTFNAGSAASGTGTIRLDITPLIGLASAELSSRIGIDVPSPQQRLVEVGTAEEYNVVQRIKGAADVWEVLALAAVAAALLGVMFGRRRLTTTALLGLGVAITGGGLWLIAENHRVFFPGLSGESDVGRLFHDALLERAAAGYSAWMLALAGAGTVLLVLGGTGRALRGRSRYRHRR